MKALLRAINPSSLIHSSTAGGWMARVYHFTVDTKPQGRQEMEGKDEKQIYVCSAKRSLHIIGTQRVH